MYNGFSARVMVCLYAGYLQVWNTCMRIIPSSSFRPYCDHVTSNWMTIKTIKTEKTEYTPLFTKAETFYTLDNC